MSPHEKDGDWGEYRRLVLAELERLNLTVTNLQLQLDNLKIASAETRVKMAAIGLLAGSVPLIIAAVVEYFFLK